MNDELDPAADLADRPGGLFVLALVSIIAGMASGLLGALFRLSLVQADRFRDTLIYWSHSEKLLGLWIVVSIAAVATAAAAWLVHKFSPQASGSGITHVELVMAGDLPPTPSSLIPVKFFGGLLAIGSGLVLGREGPSVQMGATISHLVGQAFRRTRVDCRALLAAGAGAGLATAFNAPIAGAVFVLEELVRRFDTRVTIATLGASAGAIAVGRVLLGQAPDFRVEPLSYPGLGTVPINLVLGVMAGLLGVAYNRTLLGVLAASERLHRWPPELRAAVVGGAVGGLAWFAPLLVGGGDALTQRTLSLSDPLFIISGVFLIRFGLGAVSYAAGTPGGLFAPMLVLGSQCGLLFASICLRWFPDAAASPQMFAITGMAAFFTAVVRAPVTGIILVTELTGSFTLLLPMLASCFSAMTIATLLGNPPIYDSLRKITSHR